MKCKLIDDKNNKVYLIIDYGSTVCTIRDESGKQFQIPTNYIIPVE